MAAGIAKKAKTPTVLTISLREDFRSTRRHRVDHDNGVIYGVKVVGRSSPNTHGVRGVDGTDYELEALQVALPLYEGINVNVDHPKRSQADAERSARDRFAWLEELEVTEAGIFGNLHFLDPTDPLAVKMLRAAELKPDAFALSHNAVGKGEVRGRRYVVTEIPEVHSVDVVSDGGTNRSLFEGRKMQSPVVDVLKSKVMPALQAGRKKRLARLLESIPATLLMEEGEGKDHLDHLYDAMRSAKEAGHDDVAKGVHKLMHPDNHDLEEEDESEDEKEEEEEEEGGEGEERHEMEGMGVEGPGEPGAHNEGPDSEGGPGAAIESRRRPKKKVKPTPNHVVLTEKQALKMCRTAGVEPIADVVLALREARSFEGQMAAIDLAKRAQAPTRPSTAPRSTGRIPLNEGAVPGSADTKGWANRLLS